MADSDQTGGRVSKAEVDAYLNARGKTATSSAKQTVQGEGQVQKSEVDGYLNSMSGSRPTGGYGDNSGGYGR